MAAPYNPPLKGEDFVLRVSLQDMALPGSFKANPTIAAGDFKVDKDGTALVNITVTPVVQPAGSVLVKVALTANEMDGDVITIVGIDQTFPKEWADFVLSIPTTGSDVMDVPLVLETDGVTYQSLIMKVDNDANDGYGAGGGIMSKSTLSPANIIDVYDDETGGRAINIGGGFTGERDTNGVWFWCDGDQTTAAIPDNGSPIMVLEPPVVPYDPGEVTFMADVHIVHDVGGKNFARIGWDTSNNTQCNFTIGTYSGSGVQKDLVFGSHGPVGRWRMAMSAGGHITPEQSDALDIGSPAMRLRNVASDKVTLTAPTNAETNVGALVSQMGGSIPITVLEAGEIDIGFPPGYRYRAISIGGGLAQGGSSRADINDIMFLCDDDFSDPSPPGQGKTVFAMSSIGSSSYAPFSVYGHPNNHRDYGMLSWSAALDTFNFEVGFYAGQGGMQRDLLFCTDGAVGKWRMAFTTGGSILPETDKTLDIGSGTKQVRNVWADAVAMGGGATPQRIYNDGNGYLGVGSAGNYFGLNFYNTNINDKVNSEYVSLTTTGNAYILFSSHTGTGVDRPLWVQNWNFGTGAASNLLPGGHNQLDIGSVTKTVRNIFSAAMNWMTRAAPPTPVDGDMWFTGTALQMRVGGVTKTIQMA